MVDVVDSKSTASDGVPVRVRSPAPSKVPNNSYFRLFWVLFFAFYFPISLKKAQKTGGQSEGTSFLKLGRFQELHWQKQPWNRNSDGCRCWMWWKYRCVPATPESPSGSHHWHTKDSRSHVSNHENESFASDVMVEWRQYVAEEKERQLVAIIQEENPKEEETRKFMEVAFRDGSVKATGTDIDKLMPAKSRFGGGNRAEKKQGVIAKLLTFFERFFGVG